MLGTYMVIAGMLLIFAGFILIFIASRNASNHYGGSKTDADSYSDYSGTSSDSPQYEASGNKMDVKGGGIIMLGPIPIIIGSDSNSTRALIVLSIVLMVLYFLIFM